MAVRKVAVVAGAGGHVPKRVVTNMELSNCYDTSDEWIGSRTGIASRRWGESTWNLAVAAGQLALSSAHASEDTAVAVADNPPVLAETRRVPPCAGPRPTPSCSSRPDSSKARR